MDASFALLFRDIMEDSSGPIFLWCDSSPQAGADWLLSIFDYILDQDVANCFKHLQTSYASTDALKHAAAHQDETTFDAQSVLPLVAEREIATQFLTSKIRRHRQMPMGLGSGATTLEHKCQALALKFLHETHCLESLRRVSQRVISVTVDMGVEAGVAEAHGGDIVSYLPPWIGDRDGLREDAGLDSASLPSEHVFPNALLSAGLDHVANNLLADMDSHLQSYSGWLPGFKSLAYLLSSKHLLNRLVARCVNGTPNQPLASCFETCVENVAKWRWGTIVKTLPQILRLQRALTLVWNQSLFLKGEESLQEEGDAFRCAIVTETVQDQSWWAFGHMLLELHSIGNFASSWGSVCPCHDWVTTSLDGLPENVRATKLLLEGRKVLGLDSLFDGVGCDCPLKGKRAPELASNRLLPLVRDRARAAKADVILASAPLDQEGRERVLNDYDLGCNYVFMVLEIKLGHWATPPWIFAGFGLPNKDGSHSALAKKALDEFSKLPEDQIHHHRLSWKVLRPKSSLRAQVESLAGNTESDASQFPELLSAFIPFFFVPVVERIVEGAHSQVHRHTGYRKVSGAFISCSQRLPEMDVLLDTSQGQEAFVEAFQKLRRPRQLANAFRFTTHPTWRDITSRPAKQQGGIRKLCNAIMYSTDPQTMFASHKDVRRLHKRRQGEAAQANQQLFPKQSLAVSQEGVMQCELVKHIRDSLVPGNFYSLPESGKAEPLASQLALPEPEMKRLPERPAASCIDSDCFFRVVCAKASQLRTVKASRKRLGVGDVVVTFHGSVDMTGGDQVAVDWQPRCCSDAGDPVRVLSTFGLGANVAQMRKWSRIGDVVYTLPNFACSTSSSLLRKFFEAHALEGKQGVLTTNVEDEVRVLRELLSEAWVCELDGGWQLTRHGLGQLQVSQVVSAPVPVCDVPTSLPLKLDSLTTWQLLKLMEVEGWTWSKLPQKALVSPFVLGGPKIWYSSTPNVSKEYAMCLLSAHRHLQPVTSEPQNESPCELHHGMKIVYYRKMLEGDYAAISQMVAAKSDRGRGRPTVSTGIPMLWMKGWIGTLLLISHLLQTSSLAEPESARLARPAMVLNAANSY